MTRVVVLGRSSDLGRVANRRAATLVGRASGIRRAAFSLDDLGVQVQFEGANQQPYPDAHSRDAASWFQDQSRTGDRRALQPGRCYDFAGVSDEVRQVDGATGLSYPFSVCVWFNPDTSNNGQRLFSIVDDTSDVRYTAMETSVGRKLKISRRDSGGEVSAMTAAQAWLENTWTHLAIVVQDGTDTDLYLDGVFVETLVVGSAKVLTGVDSVVLGQLRMVGPTGFFNGQLFDFRLYNDELTADEIAVIGTLSLGDTNLGPTDPLVWYKCDEGGTVTTAYDSSGNGNDGTITAVAIGTFQDDTGINDQYSFQDELGFFDDTGGASAAYLPRDESDPTKDVLGNVLTFSGQAPHDAKITAGSLSSGELTVGTTIDWAGDGALSVFAQYVAAAHGDTTYTRGDDDGPNDVLFARVKATTDDRIIIVEPAVTGQDLTDLTAYCTA